jgi:hypothetical protein
MRADAADRSRDRRFPTIPVYRFASVEDLLVGWQTHAATQYRIHESSARTLLVAHHWVGGLAAVFASLAGSSAVAAWQRLGSNATLALISALIGTAAAVLTGITTFLDLGGRAERHRSSAAGYKRLLRQLEATTPRESHETIRDLVPEEQDMVDRLEAELGGLDAEAPVPPAFIARGFERRDRSVRQRVPAAPED